MRNKGIFLIVLALLFVSSIGQAASNPKMEIMMNGDNLSVAKAPILVNGKQINDSVRSFVHDGRTLVHIRFIEENSNAKVSWEQDTKTVSVDLDGKKIKLSIDSPTATINGEKRMLDKASIPRLVRYGNDKNALTMVPLSFLSQALGFDVGWDPKTGSAFINSKAPEVNKEPEKKPVDPANKVASIKKEVVNGKDAIVIQGSKKISTNIIKMSKPERIVVDLLDSTIESSFPTTYNYDIGFVKGLRVSQFTPDSNYKADDKIVRIVLDVKDGISNADISIDAGSNKLTIIPKKVLAQDIDQNVNNKEDIGTNLSPNLGNTGKVDKDKTPAKPNVPAKDNQNTKPNSKTIVIDPGHGGSDSGAVSAGGVKEKDVNFKISMKTADLLKAKGYNVLMTRDTDATLTLNQRPDLANKNGADIFVSIHANAAGSTSASGIEVLYAPGSSGSDKEEGQLLLTKYILDELLKETGAKNRGIIKRPNLVVIRKSEMPAVLIEVGFLSNAEEVKLINDNDYQDRLAKAIVRGIDKYFESN